MTFAITMFGGGWGRQLCVVVRDDAREDTIVVRKWRAQGKKWTGLVRKPRSEVIRFATAEDAKLFKADLGALS